MSDSFRAGIAAQFHAGAHADVRIRFHLERTPEQQQQQQQEQQDAESGTGGAAASGLCFVGEPLPAHKIILAAGSTFLKARVSDPWWRGGAAAGGLIDVQTQDVRPAKKRRTSSTPHKSAGPSIPTDNGQAPAVSALPEVLVPLSSEAEVPFARQAIEYIYTGRLGADLGFEALLRVRQQACYLGIEHCPQACDQAMQALLQAGKGEGQQRPREGACTCAAPLAAEPPVLQAYACHALFPQPGTSPDATSFQPVRAALTKQLVQYFGDAVTALTCPGLYRQLLQLPAVAVRELLAADDFGTDSENSVFLLLACWLEANKGERDVSAQTRVELCGLVRLHRLSGMYLYHLLPAVEHFTISRAELAFLLRYVGAGEQIREKLRAYEPQRRLSPWYCSPARRQVGPEAGRTVEWSISGEQLAQGLGEMLETQEVVYVDARFGPSGAAVGAGAGCSAGSSSVLADGGLWWVKLVLDPAMSDAAGVMAGLTIPWQLGKAEGVVAVANFQLAVHSWAQGDRKAGWKHACDDALPAGGCGRSWPTALTLLPARGSSTGGKGSASGGVEADVAAQLARWSGWLHEGKITGSITFHKGLGAPRR